MSFKRMDKGAIDKVLNYLFRKPKKSDDGEESQFLDTSTDVPNKEFYNTLLYYRILQEEYKCKAAGSVADAMERLAISMGRAGRLEGVTILKQDMPKKETLIRGVSELLEKSEEGS